MSQTRTRRVSVTAQRCWNGGGERLASGWLLRGQGWTALSCFHEVDGLCSQKGR